MYKRYLSGIMFAAVLASGVSMSAQKSANAPAGATAQCTDGTFSTAKTEKGACSKHGGVKAWFGAAATPKNTRTPAATKTEKAPSERVGAATAPPAGATGQCDDGSYTRAKTQSGACSKHGGVKTWFAAASSAPAVPPKAAPSAPPRSTAAPAPVAPETRTAPAPKTSAPAPRTSGKAVIVAPPAGTPQDATAKCKDGTYSFAHGHSGACSRHGGVAEWYK